jgi:hypothetical protein
VRVCVCVRVCVRVCAVCTWCGVFSIQYMTSILTHYTTPQHTHTHTHTLHSQKLTAKEKYDKLQRRQAREGYMPPSSSRNHQNGHRQNMLTAQALDELSNDPPTHTRSSNSPFVDRRASGGSRFASPCAQPVVRMCVYVCVCVCVCVLHTHALIGVSTLLLSHTHTALYNTTLLCTTLHFTPQDRPSATRAAVRPQTFAWDEATVEREEPRERERDPGRPFVLQNNTRRY